jgi:hypothetical protein
VAYHGTPHQRGRHLEAIQPGENPRIVDGCTTDHDCLTAGDVLDPFDVGDRAHIPVCDHRFGLLCQLGRAFLDLAEHEDERSNNEPQRLDKRDGVTTEYAQDRPEKQDRPAEAATCVGQASWRRLLGGLLNSTMNCLS